MDKNKEKIFPEHTDKKMLANKFSAFYKDKIEKIRSSLGHAVNIDPHNKLPVGSELTSFEALSGEKVLGVIRSLENKQSMLDPMPCELIKFCKIELLPGIVKIVNGSLKMGYFPDSLKTAIVTPLIKSRKLDPDLLNNYRPVSNLTIMSKILEKCVLAQLTTYLYENNLNCKYQSAYKPGHSCETALLKIYDDLHT